MHALKGATLLAAIALSALDARQLAVDQNGVLLGPSLIGPDGKLIRPYVSLPDGPVIDEELWFNVLRNYPVHSAWSADERADFLEKWNSLDYKKLPDVWLYAFYNKRLIEAGYIGDWAEVEVVTSELKDIIGQPGDPPLLLADLLGRIAGFRNNIGFAPPEGLLSEASRQARSDYWERNIKDLNEAEALYQSIVDNFDAHYATTAMSRSSLAFLQLMTRKPAEALRNFKAFEGIERERIFVLPRFRLSSNQYEDLDALYRQSMSGFDGVVRMLPELMMRAAAGLPNDQFLQEAAAILQRYSGNEKAKELFDRRLQHGAPILPPVPVEPANTPILTPSQPSASSEGATELEQMPAISDLALPTEPHSRGAQVSAIVFGLIVLVVVAGSAIVIRMKSL
jgi:hypothetical protein